MSAICGIIRTDGAPVDPAELRGMVDSMPWRGPDGRIHWIEGNAGLAHLAFHVTPESVNERQPLVSADGRLVLVADVRLDNRAELASKLGIDQRELADRTDPDLLLEAYRHWGERLVEHLLGDFVFAVWNGEKNELFLARDPIGCHGITLYHDDRVFIFASETAAVLGHPTVPAEIDSDHLLKTLAFVEIEQDETPFKSVRHLPPAHSLRLRAGRVEARRYWAIDPALRVSYRDRREYIDQFLDLMDRAVTCRLRSIGPVGLSLSGGLDSSLLAAIGARRIEESPAPQDRLNSFSYVFDEFPQCDERAFIEPVVAHCGLEATYIPASHLWTFRQPSRELPSLDFIWTNSYIQLLQVVAESAHAAGCRVLLDGQLGDALFCEPSRFAADLLRRGQFGRLVELLRLNSPEISPFDELVHRGLRPLAPDGLRRAYRRIRPRDRKAQLQGLTEAGARRVRELSARVRREPGFLPGVWTRHRRVFSSSWSQGYAATRGNLYNRVGVERSSPYFDRRLIEFIMAIPTEEITHSGRPRKLQHEAMARLLPEPVANRESKTTFAPLLWHGVLEKERDFVADLVDGSELVRSGYTRENWLRENTRTEKPPASHGYYLAACLHAEHWLRHVAGAFRLATIE